MSTHNGFGHVETTQAPLAANLAIAALADQCVMCGLCQPHCPSYRVKRIEGESPRGRIAYAKALAQGSLAADSTMLEHLDDCLACGSCERVCPSQVRYDEILVRTRAELGPLRTSRSANAWLGRLIRSRALRWFAPGLIRAARSRFLHGALTRLSPRLAELASVGAGLTHPQLAGGPAAETPACGTQRGHVALFRGCIAASADTDTLRATSTVLSRLGYRVTAPELVRCCGSLQRHAGQLAAASSAQLATRATFDAVGADTVTHSSSGCHQELVATMAGNTRVSVREISTLLENDPGLGQLALKRLDLHVALLLPCTQRNLDDGVAVRKLLARIPGLRVSELPLQPRCCGAAGSYFMDHPEISRPLRAERLRQIMALAPDAVVTTNIGCRLYLAAGLRELDREVPVVHAVSLLARALS